ncbi:MAG: iron ABC transporter permease [Clostridia bacterium]|nr:iron ABC transporter permease [Clostridia bacterium]
MKNKKHITDFFCSYKGYLCLSSLLIIVFVCSLSLGSAKMSFVEFFNALLFKGEENTTILYSIRLPRILAGIICGIGLSVSGVLLQTVTDNALASPGIIGVSSGAGFFVVISMIFPISFHMYLTPFFAFTGAFITTLAVVFISRIAGGTKTSVILSGVAINTFLNALISLITLIDSDILVSYNAFSIGSLVGVQYKDLLIPFVFICISFVFCIIFSKKIDILYLGEFVSTSLGINYKKLTFICIILASFCASSVISFGGLIGFVGLIVPHLSRFLCGNNTKSLLINSALIGGIITLLADLFGRIVFAPSEMPVGITLAFIGVPFFIVLLLKNRGRY